MSDLSAVVAGVIRERREALDETERLAKSHARGSWVWHPPETILEGVGRERAMLDALEAIAEIARELADYDPETHEARAGRELWRSVAAGLGIKTGEQQ